MKDLEVGVHLTAAAVAASLSVSENALAKMRSNGEGPPFIKIGRRVRYPKTDYEGWLKAKRFPSTPHS